MSRQDDLAIFIQNCQLPMSEIANEYFIQFKKQPLMHWKFNPGLSQIRGGHMLTTTPVEEEKGAPHQN